MERKLWHIIDLRLSYHAQEATLSFIWNHVSGELSNKNFIFLLWSLPYLGDVYVYHHALSADVLVQSVYQR